MLSGRGGAVFKESMEDEKLEWRAVRAAPFSSWEVAIRAMTELRSRQSPGTLQEIKSGWRARGEANRS